MTLPISESNRLLPFAFDPSRHERPLVTSTLVPQSITDTRCMPGEIYGPMHHVRAALLGYTEHRTKCRSLNLPSEKLRHPIPHRPAGPLHMFLSVIGPQHVDPARRRT